MGRQLKSIEGNNKTISYKYNDSGIRTEKTVNGITTKYYLSGDAVTLEDNGTDKIYYTYDADGDLISMNLNGKEYFYIRNVQNDVIGLHDTEGKVVVNYSYDTWGNIVSISGSLKDSVGKKNPYRYRGYRYDEETGLYYLQSRYYNAEWGRFINADAGIAGVGSVQGYNLFQYCNNNPVNMSDGNGYWPKWMKKAAKAVKKTVSKVVKNVVQKVKSVISPSKTKPQNNIVSKISTNSNNNKNNNNKNNGTVTVGMAGRIGAGITISGGIGVTIDRKGNVALQANGALGAGTPNVGVGPFVTVTNAPTYEKLEEFGTQSGGSLCIPPIGIGADYVTTMKDKDGIYYSGASLSGGLAVKPFADVHTEIPYTVTIFHFNIFELFNN